MGKNYVAPQMNVYFFNSVDVICTSTGETYTTWGSLWSEPEAGGDGE